MSNQLSLTTPRERIGSIDAFRGLVMLLMMAEVLHLAQVARAFPDSGLWQWLGCHQSHVNGWDARCTISFSPPSHFWWVSPCRFRLRVG